MQGEVVDRVSQQRKARTGQRTQVRESQAERKRNNQKGDVKWQDEEMQEEDQEGHVVEQEGVTVVAEEKVIRGQRDNQKNKTE